MAALLPCPFCGGLADTDEQQAYCNIVSGRIETAVAIYCQDCGAQHSICRGDVPDVRLEEVAALWNKRPATDTVADLRDALADCLAELSPLMGAYRPQHAEAICGKARDALARAA